MEFIYKHPEIKEAWETDAVDFKTAERRFIDRWIFASQSGQLDNVEGSFSEGEVCLKKDL